MFTVFGFENFQALNYLLWPHKPFLPWRPKILLPHSTSLKNLNFFAQNLLFNLMVVYPSLHKAMAEKEYKILSCYNLIPKTGILMVWRKVLQVLFMIFEFGPYLEPIWIVLPSESIRWGVKAFFHPKNWLRSLGPKKREKSKRCFIFVWRKVLMV